MKIALFKGLNQVALKKMARKHFDLPLEATEFELMAKTHTYFIPNLEGTELLVINNCTDSDEVDGILMFSRDAKKANVQYRLKRECAKNETECRIEYTAHAFTDLLEFSTETIDYSPKAKQIAFQQMHIFTGKLSNILGELSLQHDLNDQIESLVPSLNFWLAQLRHIHLLNNRPAIPNVNLRISCPADQESKLLLEVDGYNTDQKQANLTSISKFLKDHGMAAEPISRHGSEVAAVVITKPTHFAIRLAITCNMDLEFLPHARSIIKAEDKQKSTRFAKKKVTAQ
jgi:hypothetical protein